MDRNRIVAGLDVHKDRDFHVSTKPFHLLFGYDLAALCRILPFNPLAELYIVLCIFVHAILERRLSQNTQKKNLNIDYQKLNKKVMLLLNVLWREDVNMIFIRVKKMNQFLKIDC